MIISKVTTKKSDYFCPWAQKNVLQINAIVETVEGRSFEVEFLAKDLDTYVDRLQDYLKLIQREDVLWHGITELNVPVYCGVNKVNL